MQFREATLSHDSLLFDPNNYRYQDEVDFVDSAEDRFHEESVQAKAYNRLRGEESLVQLKQSILTNGFIPTGGSTVTPGWGDPPKTYLGE